MSVARTGKTPHWRTNHHGPKCICSLGLGRDLCDDLKDLVMSETAPLILLVEDSDNDVLLFRTAAAKTPRPLRLEVVTNGPSCLNYLLGAGRYRNRAQFPFPAMVLLDLGLPGMNGLDVLKEIREQPELVRLPVVVLTTSDAIRDVNKAYELGANSFLVKPIDPPTISSLVTALTRHSLQPGVGSNSSRMGASPVGFARTKF